MVNSGLRTVGIITPYNYRPILDHIGAGKDWHLDRKSGGMFILPGVRLGLYPQYHKLALKDLIRNIDFLERDHADYVIISGCNNIFNLDYTAILCNHEEHAADVSMVYKEMAWENADDSQGVFLKVDDNNRVAGIARTKEPVSSKVNYFTDIFVASRRLLIDILKGHEDVQDMDFIDVLEENLRSLKIAATPITGYFGRVYSLQSYFQRSMEMLDPAIREELFMGDRRIHTKIKDNPPTKYGAHSIIGDALVSSGCLIEGQVERSIIFRGVRVEAGAAVTNSIIMQGCVIGKGAVLDHVIIDKFGRVNRNVVIKGEPNSPVVLKKNTVV
jgi:glucose-1-phosphate adenylyltransferase, GlgD subunit